MSDNESEVSPRSSGGAPRITPQQFAILKQRTAGPTTALLIDEVEASWQDIAELRTQVSVLRQEAADAQRWDLRAILARVSERKRQFVDAHRFEDAANTRGIERHLQIALRSVTEGVLPEPGPTYIGTDNAGVITNLELQLSAARQEAETLREKVQTLTALMNDAHFHWQKADAEAETLRGQLEPLRRFAGEALTVARDGYDWDGGDEEKALLDCGLLERVSVAEPCGESCVCLEFTARADFPVDCLRQTELGKSCLAARVAAPTEER